MARISILFRFLLYGHWPVPRSLATTKGISFDFFSSGYWDVSIPRVCFTTLCIQIVIPLLVGFPIRKSSDQSFIAAPRRISQRSTSFIAVQCQGILQVLFKTLDTITHRDKTNLSSVVDRLMLFSAYTHCAILGPRRKCIGPRNMVNLYLWCLLHDVLEPVSLMRNQVKEVMQLLVSGFFFNEIRKVLILKLISGGDDRDRTDDLLNANQALSQLSYVPARSFK